MSGTSRFDCFPSDFLNGVIGLPADAIAVYTIVMMLQYDRGAPVRYTGREREIAIRSGMSVGRLAKAVAELIDLGKLYAADGCLTNHRVEREIAKISQKIAKNRENSRKGGESTRQKFQTKTSKINDGGGPVGQPNGQPNDSPISPVPLPSSNKKTSSLRSDVRRASRIPDDWAPTEADRQFARDEGLNDVDVDRAVPEFVDFWRAESGAKAVKLDWSLTFRNRVRTLAQRKPSGHVNGARAGPRFERRNSTFQAVEELLLEDRETPWDH